MMMNNCVRSEVLRENFRPGTDTVAAIMWSDPVVLPPLCRVNEAIERVRQVGLPEENMNTCYVVAEDYTLLGLVSLRTLLLTRGGARLETVMSHPFATVQPQDDQELAAQLMQEYDLLELPVVDGDNRLMGVVTADDAMEVLQAEATEDMVVMAAMSPSEEPYLESPVYRLFRSRIPWLMLLMLSATFTSGIISHFEDALAAQVTLTAFIPMLMDTGGNCGSQSSVTVIRALSLDELHFTDLFRVMWKEARTAVLCGAALAAACFLKILLVDRLLMGNESISLLVNGVVCLTLCVTVILAKFVGCTLPLFAKRLGFDPAVMASPFITTIVDALSLLVYFLFAKLLLGV